MTVRKPAPVLRFPVPQPPPPPVSVVATRDEAGLRIAVEVHPERFAKREDFD